MSVSASVASVRSAFRDLIAVAELVPANWENGHHFVECVNALDRHTRLARQVLESTPAPDTFAITEALSILETWSMSGDDVDRKVRGVIRRARAQLRNLRASR
jgi:hypothetical protein